MFDATNGKKVFEVLYDKVLTKNDPQLWYECGYVTWECWKYAASEAIEAMAYEDVADLMAYIIKCSPDDTMTVFVDGFTYLLGQMMENEYEMGE